MAEYLYTDPRGRRSGPYSEAELKFLAERGLLEPHGRIELPGLAEWPVEEVPWLRAEGASAAAERRDADAESVEVRIPSAGTAAPVPPSAPPDAVPDAMAADGNAFRQAARTARAPMQQDSPPCSRVVFVLLALLPPFIGLFGVHSLVAGYFTRGIVSLVLSIFTFGGVLLIVPPCACIGVPIWFVLFTLSVIDAITVTRDAQGRVFS